MVSSSARWIGSCLIISGCAALVPDPDPDPSKANPQSGDGGVNATTDARNEDGAVNDADGLIGSPAAGMCATWPPPGDFETMLRRCFDFDTGPPFGELQSMHATAAADGTTNMYARCVSTSTKPAYVSFTPVDWQLEDGYTLHFAFQFWLNVPSGSVAEFSVATAKVVADGAVPKDWEVHLRVNGTVLDVFLTETVGANTQTWGTQQLAWHPREWTPVYFAIRSSDADYWGLRYGEPALVTGKGGMPLIGSNRRFAEFRAGLVLVEADPRDAFEARIDDVTLWRAPP